MEIKVGQIYDSYASNEDFGEITITYIDRKDVEYIYTTLQTRFIGESPKTLIRDKRVFIDYILTGKVVLREK